MSKIDNCINEGSNRVIESIDAEYVNVSVFCPLSGSTYIELPRRLRNSMKGLINIKNNDNKCFLWCHIRHLNPLKIHPERIIKADKNMVNEGNESPSLKEILARLKRKVIFALVYFAMKTTWFILFIYQMKKIKTIGIY